MKKFTLLVLGDPVSSDAARLALRFGTACEQLGHRVHSVFFYADAARIALRGPDDAAIGTDCRTEWQAFSSRTGTQLIACISSAYRRGVLDADEAETLGLPATLEDGFALAGLGQLAEAMHVSDRVVTFP